jgi:uncharacterized protein YrrD
VQRVTDLVGKTIVTSETGEKIGRAADLLLSPTGNRVIGVVVGGGVLAGERVLAYEDVKTLGRDTIIARSQQHVMDPRQWHERGIGTWRSSSLENKLVVAWDGREVGTIADIYVDEHTGEVEAYDVAHRAFAGLIVRPRVLLRPGDLTLGPDVVVVSSETADRLEANERETKAAKADDHGR